MSKLFKLLSTYKKLTLLYEQNPIKREINHDFCEKSNQKLVEKASKKFIKKLQFSDMESYNELPSKLNEYNNKDIIK